MNFGPGIFLSAFAALAFSWLGLVLLPQLQIGGLVPEKADQLTREPPRTNWLARQKGLTVTDEGTGDYYPAALPGLALRGREVYRANGCHYCHTMHVRQTGAAFDLVVTQTPTNITRLVQTVAGLRPGLTFGGAAQMLETLPATIVSGLTRVEADALAKSVEAAGAEVVVKLVPLGVDIARGWGLRQSVAQDYVRDYPVMLGNQRVGPDLTNIGLRRPDVHWHLRHLYHPQSEVPGSTMPPYRYLFAYRRIEFQPSPDALDWPPEFAPPAGYEVVPTEDARALAVFLASLRADASLFEAPLSPPLAAPPPAAAPATTGSPAETNSPPASAPQ